MVEGFGPSSEDMGISEGKSQYGTGAKLTRRELLFGRQGQRPQSDLEQQSELVGKDLSRGDGGDSSNSSQKRRLTRRQFLRGAGAVAAGAGLAAATHEALQLAEKGVTVGHLINTVRHIIADPDLLPAYQKAQEGVKRGEVVPDLSTMEQRASSVGKYHLVDIEIPKWRSASSSESEQRPIKSHAVVISTENLRGSFGDEPSGAVSIPISDAIPLGRLVEPDDSSGFGLGLGVFAVNAHGDTEILLGDRYRAESIQQGGGEIRQVPFAFSADEEIPPAVANDTYLWCIVGIGDGVLVAHDVEPGVRVSVGNQRKMVDKVFEEQELGVPQRYLLTAKGSSSGIGFSGTDKGYLGHPLAMARNQSYLNFE